MTKPNPLAGSAKTVTSVAKSKAEEIIGPPA